MADVRVSREHGLDHEEAKTKVKEIVADLERTLDPLDTVDWKSDSHADISGKGFSGFFAVDDSNITVELDLRFFAKPFKGKIQDKIKSRIDNHFG